MDSPISWSRRISEEQKAQVEAKRQELSERIGKYVTESVERNDEIVQAKQAYKAAKGKGVRREAKAIHRTQKTDNDVAERTMTFATKAQMEEAVKANPELKDHVGYVKDDGIEILRALKQKAEMQYKNPSTSNDDVDINKKWDALRKIEIPLETDSAEEIERFIRALNPFIIANTTFRGNLMKIMRAEVASDAFSIPHPAGTVSKIEDDKFYIATSKGLIVPTVLQFGSFFIGDSKDFIRIVNPKIGEEFK
mgnify:CR=1 FL=1